MVGSKSSNSKKQSCIEVVGAVCSQLPVVEEALVYRTVSRSDRIQALNQVLQVFLRKNVDCGLNIGSGRYGFRFCNHSPTLCNGFNLMKLKSAFVVVSLNAATQGPLPS